jgi:hypothetical protein
MYMSFATHIHVTRIAAMRMIFTRIGCTLLTYDMYMCRERHIHDPVLSSYSVYYHYLVSPHSFLQQATPHIRLRNAFQGQRCEKQRNEF